MKTAADVEREVETSRSNLDRTVEALKDKMSPGQLFDEASRVMGASGQQVFAKFMEQAKENPMPLAVMGLGLAWLMTSQGRGQGQASTGYEPRSFAPESRHGLAATADGIGDKAADLVAGVKDKLSDARTSIGEGGRSAAEGLSSAAHTVREKAGDYRHQAQDTFARVLEREPLLVGAVGLIVGAAIGAALPHTEVEDEAVGRLRDKVVEKGKEMAQETLHQAKDVAQAAYAGVKDELANPDGEQADLKDRAEAVGHTAIQAARDQIQGQSN